MLELTTVEKVKELHARLSSTASTHDELLQTLVAAASRSIQKYLGVDFELTEHTDVFDVRVGECDFDLRSWPVASSPAAIVKNTIVGEFDDVDALSDSLYRIDRRRGRLLFRGGYELLAGPQALEVVYTGGVAESSEDLVEDPEYGDLVLACSMQVLDWYKQAPNFGSKARNVGGAAQSFDYDEKSMQLAPRVKGLLSGYERLGV